MDETPAGTIERDETLDPWNTLHRNGWLALRIFAWLVLAASLWGLTNLAQLWNRPAKLVSGTPARVVEEDDGGRFRYRVPFTVNETGEVLMLRVHNNGAVIDYFMTKPGTPVAVLYWPSEMTIASVHPLVAGEPSIRGQYPPYNALLGTSVLGVLLALVLLSGGRLDRALYQAGRG
jgi:hypothetical protein